MNKQVEAISNVVASADLPFTARIERTLSNLVSAFTSIRIGKNRVLLEYYVTNLIRKWAEGAEKHAKAKALAAVDFVEVAEGQTKVIAESPDCVLTFQYKRSSEYVDAKGLVEDIEAFFAQNEDDALVYEQAMNMIEHNTKTRAGAKTYLISEK